MSRGRPRGSIGSNLKVPKRTASVRLTVEAWAILDELSDRSGLSKSEYLENMVRRSGEMMVFDKVRKFLIDFYSLSDKDLEALSKVLDKLKANNELIKPFLASIGVSPNQIP